ncbi:MAG: response regulator transcription factor [Patescibacteria group bacterium]|jgi:DNA-binding response OmpR family regulator
MHILLIEDDIRIAANIKKFLIKESFLVTHVDNGEDALFQAETETYDVIILDWMLPDKDGPTICKSIRLKQNTTPILMLTAKSQVEDTVEGLTSGADDYLTKPFSFEELLARIKALIRRKSGTTQSAIISVNDLVIDTNLNTVKRSNKIISLSPREYSLLEYLAVHKNKTIDRITLLHHVWGEDIDPLSNTIDVHIRYLRKKIDDNFKKKLIRTVKNKGYILCSS